MMLADSSHSTTEIIHPTSVCVDQPRVDRIRKHAGGFPLLIYAQVLGIQGGGEPQGITD